MKIVQVQTQAEAAGAQRVSDMVGDGLRASGHDVRTVFMYRKTEAYDGDPHADFILTERPRGPVDLLRAIVGLIGYMRRVRPDAVISYQHYGNIFGTLAGRLAGARQLIANQSGAPGKRGAMRAAAIVDRLMGQLGAYTHSVVNSAWTEAQFRDYPRSYRQRLRRIDHGVLLPDGPHSRQDARAEFGLPDNAYILVSTGRLTPDKNHAPLVAALELLPEVHLAVAGAGPEEPALMALATRLGVADRLHLVGEVRPARIFDFLASGDLYVFPSRNETFGLAVAEAAMVGLPVVANGIPVLREVLGEAALFVEASQPAQLAEAVRQVMSQPDLASRLAAKGRALSGRYAPATMCRRYEELLES